MLYVRSLDLFTAHNCSFVPFDQCLCNPPVPLADDLALEWISESGMNVFQICFLFLNYFGYHRFLYSRINFGSSLLVSTKASQDSGWDSVESVDQFGNN